MSTVIAGVTGAVSAAKTKDFVVPAGAVEAYIYVPTLDSCTFTIKGTLDGTNFGTIYETGDDIQSFATFTGGAVMVVPVAGLARVQVNSSVNQTVTYQVTFVD